MMQNMRHMLKEAKILGLSLGIGAVIALLAAAFTFMYSHTVQAGIADNVLRFHVVANSDDPADQAVKNQVRDAVLAAYEAQLLAAYDLGDLADMRRFFQAHLDEIADYAQAFVHGLGLSYPVRASLTQVFFPTRVYGGLVFPPGRYETLQITIGDGAGGNWWCLMFPPLCYMEMTGTPATRDMLASAVPAEGMRILTHQEQSASVTVRFRVVEWWQNLRRS